MLTVSIVFACVCLAVWFCLPNRAVITSDCVGFGGLLSAGKGTSAVAPPMDLEDGRLLETGLRSTGDSRFSDGNPAFGLQLHHPRFLKFVGAPESARLLDCSSTFWVDQLGKEQAMAAAVNLQRDAGIMLSNLQIL